MKKIIAIIPLAAIAFFFVQSCGTDETKTNNDSAGSATVAPSTNGRVLFEEKCTVCHGSDGKQNTLGAADLSTSKLDHEIVVTIIKSGKNGMKAFSPELNDEQIEAVAAYVESLRK